MVNEVDVQALDEYYTVIRARMRETGLSRDQAEQIVQREALEQLDKMERESPHLIDEVKAVFPDMAARWENNVGKKLEAYRAENRAERTMQNLRELHRPNSNSHIT